jgi:hypothetical protein
MRRLVDKMPAESKPALLEALNKSSRVEFSNDRLELFPRRGELDPRVSFQISGSLSFSYCATN